MKEDLTQRHSGTAEEIWKKNSDILQKQYSGLFEQLNITDVNSSADKEEFPHEIKIETAPAGDPTMSINGLHVHSPRDPAREGERLALTAESGEGPVIILGFGLGYSALYAAKNAVKINRPVIIVEKYFYLLCKAFELHDLTELLSAKNIIFAVGNAADGIINALNIAYELIKKNDDDEKPAPSIIRNRALIDLDKEWYKNIEEKIKTYSMKDKVNTATLKRFGKRWVRNIARNMSVIRDLPGVDRIFTQRCSGTAIKEAFPVFLAAAGPSLDKIKPLLHDIYNRCIIIAVDTNMRFFTDNGIPPDFVLTVDPQYWNSRHLDRCDFNEEVREKTTLVIESAVFSSIPHLPYKRKLLMSSLFPLSRFIEKKTDNKGRLGAGGSVATTAWDFARSLTAKDIWIAGLDLAFPDYKTHFKGARFEEIANCESCRLSPAEAWVFRALRDGIPFKTKSANGGQVLTDSRLSLYAVWFENQFGQHKNITNLALFQEGLAINGLQAAGAEDILALPACRSEIDAYLEQCYAQIETGFNSAEEALKRSERYEAAVLSLTRGLNSIKKAADEGIAIITKNDKKDSTKEIDRILKKIAESEVKEITSFLMPITGNNKTTESDYFKSSLKLFESLSESAAFYLELLEKRE